MARISQSKIQLLRQLGVVGCSERTHFAVGIAQIVLACG